MGGTAKVVQKKRSGGKGGKKNMNKSRQPKRQRYVLSQRGHKRRLKSLRSHIEHHPNDVGAPDALVRLAATWGLSRVA